MIQKRFSFNLLASVLITAGLVYAVFEATQYSFLAKIFPFYISLFLLVISIINLFTEISKVLSTKPNFVNSNDIKDGTETPLSVKWKQLSRYVGYIIIMYIGVGIFGYPISMSLFIVLFYRYIAQTSWRSSMIAGVLGFAFLALASKLFNMDWPIGLITLPWPLG